MGRPSPARFASRRLPGPPSPVVDAGRGGRAGARKAGGGPVRGPGRRPRLVVSARSPRVETSRSGASSDRSENSQDSTALAALHAGSPCHGSARSTAEIHAGEQRPFQGIGRQLRGEPFEARGAVERQQPERAAHGPRRPGPGLRREALGLRGAERELRPQVDQPAQPAQKSVAARGGDSRRGAGARGKGRNGDAAEVYSSRLSRQSRSTKPSGDAASTSQCSSITAPRRS